MTQTVGISVKHARKLKKKKAGEYIAKTKAETVRDNWTF